MKQKTNMKLKQNKKGVLGLELSRSVIVTLLVLAVTAIAVFLALVSLQDSGIFKDDSNSITNETGAWLNVTTYTVDQSTADGFSNLVITQAFNNTDDTIINVGNFTVVGTGFTNSSVLNWDDVSVSYTYSSSSSSQSDTNLIIGNITEGTVEFFAFTPTWMILLAVAVLIAIIAIVIFAVTRLEGNGNDVRL